MSRDEALIIIKKCLESVLEEEVVITEESHLIDDEILDSLDSAVFIFEVESETSKKLPDGDIGEHDLYKVSKLIDYLLK